MRHIYGPLVLLQLLDLLILQGVFILRSHPNRILRPMEVSSFNILTTSAMRRFPVYRSIGSAASDAIATSSAHTRTLS